MKTILLTAAIWYTAAHQQMRPTQVVEHERRPGHNSEDTRIMVGTTLHARWPIVQIPNGNPDAIYCEIPEHIGYAVGSDNSIWSRRVIGQRTSCGVWHQRKLAYDRYGYAFCDLWNCGIKFRAYLHVLLAKCFIGDPKENDEVRHKNGVSSDNSLSNLQWGTHQQNLNDKRRHGTDPSGERNHFSKLTEADVREILRLHRTGQSQGMIARRFGVCQPTVHYIVSRKTWKNVR